MKAAFDPNARKRPVNLTLNEDLVDSADVTDSVEADAPCGNLQLPAGVHCLPVRACHGSAHALDRARAISWTCGKALRGLPQHGEARRSAGGGVRGGAMAPQSVGSDRTAWSKTLKRPSPVLMLMAVLAVLSAGLWAQSVGPKSVSSDRTDEIRALENAFDAAIVRRDVSALDKMTSDDFTLISLNGDLHAKAEVLKYFAIHASESEYRKNGQFEISSVRGCGRGDR